MEDTKDVQISQNDSIISQIIENGSFFGLTLTGKILKFAIDTGDSIAMKIEPLAMPIVSRLPLTTLKKILHNDRASLLHRLESEPYSLHPKFYQVRNQLLEVINMGFFALPYTFELISPLVTPTSKFEGGIESEDSLAHYHIYASGTQSEQLCWTFAGSEWLLFYEIGVAQCIYDSADINVLSQLRFAGAGTGSIVATCLALKIDLKVVQKKLITLVTRISKRLFGPVGCLSGVWRDFLEDVIPEIDNLDNKLLISLSKFPSFQNILLDEFYDRNELIECILASCYMPILFETPIKVRGIMCVNGAWTNRMPIGNELTISTSPHPGKGNICPRFIRYTVSQEIFPTDNSVTLNNMVDDGYVDARAWLRRMCACGALPSNFFKKDFQSQTYTIE